MERSREAFLMQSRLFSFIESVSNVVIGYSISVLAQIIIFPIFDINVSIESNLKIGLFFTIVSIIRSYILRRIFNFFQKKA